ncbi:hypothetical protein HUJ04_001232 [Dendroctonus ponderosae]|nr:hypothetical protein HUJ04_001232 [Dendroctonus ponderosae]KAH1011968.1 hypothetical protein HUJ04_001232 [Dendroctonus ponderosae]
MSDIGSGDEGSSSQKYQGMEQGSEYDSVTTRLEFIMENRNTEWVLGKIQYWQDPTSVFPSSNLHRFLVFSGQQGQMEQELATKMLQIQSKRFYLDVKQNRRGRFIKVAEIGADGRRSQIFLALSTAAEFRDHLSTFSDYYSSLGPPNPDNVPEDGKLKSEMMIKDNRRYYLDLKENSRGRFLRVSQTITRGGPRSQVKEDLKGPTAPQPYSPTAFGWFQVAIPAQGMIEFRDALTDLLDEFSTDEHAYKPDLPEGRHMHVDNKNFYFDIVKTNFRTAITLPEKSWARFRDILSDYCDKIKQPAGASGAPGGALGVQDQPHPLVGNNTQQDGGTSLK